MTNWKNSSPLPHADIDPDGLLEYSVVFTDRSLNHMSQRFVGVMQELLRILKTTYNAHTAAIVPGGGTYAMESIARQFGSGKRCLVIRNGLFSYRWTQIFETGGFTADHSSVKATQVEGPNTCFAPPSIDAVKKALAEFKPDIVFAAHVETAAGIVLPDDYLQELSAAIHEAGALFVLDCVASGALWVDMEARGVDILLSAPQKGWSGTPCAGYVMFNKHAREAIENTTSNSFALDLKKWLGIAEGYVDGKPGYHTTMPTDSLARNLQQMQIAERIGLNTLKEKQIELGTQIRQLLEEKGFSSVAAPGFEAASVVVANVPEGYGDMVAKLKEAGVQVAAGTPLQIGEPENYSSFRVGLFGLDKLQDVRGATARFSDALSSI